MYYSSNNLSGPTQNPIAPIKLNSNSDIKILDDGRIYIECP